MTKKIYQIQIELKGAKPKIWRRVLVNSDILLVDFHKIIQTTIGWTNSILPPHNQVQIPKCIAGKRNCPPEDCGGIWGYSDMLNILKQPGHEEYESFTEWLGDDFDPEYFNIDEINEMLKQKDFGCIWL